MEKKIEDYLHLYVGCDVLVKDWKGKLIRAGNEESGYPCEVGGDNQDEESGFYGEWEEYELKAAFIKPILLPLSEMTNEELNEIGNIECIEITHKKRAEVLKGISEFGMKHIIIDDIKPETVFEITRYLLSKHFDLFGLIEAGIAIDKTKLSKEPNDAECDATEAK